MRVSKKCFSLMLLWSSLFCLSSGAYAHDTPQGFVYVRDMIPNIVVELRYATDYNFVGRPIDGYLTSRCLLSKEAGQALAKVQKELNRFALGLKIYDAYRPQRAVNHFVRWARDVDDTKMKKYFYPDVDKRDLFRLGYIAEKSGHSRGSTVDVTIISLAKATLGVELDFGTVFDFFGPQSWVNSASVSQTQRAHRMLLNMLMTTHGFVPYEKEWWHFTLKNEPYPDTYFDFPVQ